MVYLLSRKRGLIGKVFSSGFTLPIIHKHFVLLHIGTASLKSTQKIYNSASLIFWSTYISKTLRLLNLTGPSKGSSLGYFLGYGQDERCERLYQILYFEKLAYYPDHF